MDKITIIGANRFLGFHLINYFLEQGIEVDGIILEQENDLLPTKKQLLKRNANYRFIKEDELDNNHPVIIDAYLYEDIFRVQQMTEKIHDNYLVLLHKNCPVISDRNYLLLENIFGEWDEIKEQDEINDSDYYYVRDICEYINNYLNNEKNIEIELFHKTKFKEAMVNRNKWLEKYKKSK